MSLLRRPPIFSFSAGQLPDMLFSLAVGRSTLSLCRPCSSCREIHGVGSRSAPKQTSRERRMAKNELLRRNRRNPELEKAARTLTLSVPLDEAQGEWQLHGGLAQLQTAGTHFNLFQDVYGRPFRPLGFMEVTYGSKAVHRGTILTPSEASSPPSVGHLPSEGLCSVVMTTPDGHLTDHHMEVLHWMVVNIVGGEMTSGHEVVPYLQPVPPRGTGLHRHVFSLYTHPSPIHVDTTRMNSGGTWLDQRTFSTADFLAAQPSLRPFTFNLFQSLWDNSVHTAYMESLVYPEPVYGVERELTPRRQKQEITRLHKANHYRIM